MIENDLHKSNMTSETRVFNNIEYTAIFENDCSKFIAYKVADAHCIGIEECISLSISEWNKLPLA